MGFDNSYPGSIAIIDAARGQCHESFHRMCGYSLNARTGKVRGMISRNSFDTVE